MRGVEEGASAVQWPRWADEDHELAPPPVGTQVAGYRLERQLGEGGQGTVYRASRDGQSFALKFLALSRSGWAWRELEVGLRLRYRGSLQVLGHGLWPPTRPCFLYLVFPYVRGRPLPDWTRQHNPSAREVIRVMRELAQQVGDIHRAGVVHRDIKGANILIRHEDGRPVLVDFGVGTYVGAPEITHPMSLPGTPHYRSPEALRFRRGHIGEHSPARRSDDLWALGVVLYVLLTGSHPFEPLDPRAGEGALADLILDEEPEAPHERNPRVPRALSELCLRMLEKFREARFQTAWGVDEALEDVLADADATWDAPLCETWSAEEATTPQEEALDLGDWLDKTRRLRLYARRPERRGRPLPPERASTLPRTPESAPPEEHRAGPAASHPDLPLPHPRPPRVWALLGLLVLLLPCAISREPLQRERELATPDGVPEGVNHAVSSQEATPTSIPSATPSKDIPRVKTSQKAIVPRPPQQKPSSRLGGLAKACGSALAVGQLACATAPAPTPVVAQPVVEEAPPPAECPAGAVENMRTMGVEPFNETVILFQHGKDLVQAMPRVLHHGDPFLLEVQWGKFPRNTLFTGPFIFGKNRVYVRITQALIPGRPEPLPVCLVSPQSEAQVEVYRQPRPIASYQWEAEETQARLLQCQAALHQERTERGQPPGLLGLLALNHMGVDGVHSQDITNALTFRQGEAFKVRTASSYRATTGASKTPMMRLAVDLQFMNDGPLAWRPTHARLVGLGGQWKAEVWTPAPMAPGEQGRVLAEVERPGSEAPGTYVLELWDEEGQQRATLSGVTFP